MPPSPWNAPPPELPCPAKTMLAKSTGTWQNTGVMESLDAMKERIRGDTENIVRRGANIAKEVSRLTVSAAARFQGTADGMVGLVRTVAEGAARAADESLPEKDDSKLRQVVDGLADGLRTTAEAIDLTVRESGAEGLRFAREDVRHTQDDLVSLLGMFASTVADFAYATTVEAAAGAATIRDHAAHTLERTRPSFEKAARTLVGEAGQVGGEAAAAGSAAARAAAGLFFREVGARLSRLGEVLKPTAPAEAPDTPSTNE